MGSSDTGSIAIKAREWPRSRPSTKASLLPCLDLTKFVLIAHHLSSLLELPQRLVQLVQMAKARAVADCIYRHQR